MKDMRKMKQEKIKYRNELKYICAWNELEIIRHRLTPFMKRDQNNMSGEDFYRIRSLYFDTYTDRCVEENESGINDRKKIRIRIYNGSDHFKRLEIKYKKNGLTRKESCILSEEQYDAIVSGRPEELFPLTEEPLRLLYVAMATEYMKPKIMVEYERTAFVCPFGNVRITLDRNIMASDRTEDFLKTEFKGKPVLGTGVHLLEIKYDEFLPEYIENALGNVRLQRTSFSKYYLSRMAMNHIFY